MWPISKGKYDRTEEAVMSSCVRVWDGYNSSGNFKLVYHRIYDNAWFSFALTLFLLLFWPHACGLSSDKFPIGFLIEGDVGIWKYQPFT